MSVDKLLSRLDGVKNSGKNRWMARCPSHRDKSPSLSVRTVEDGKILCHCFAGCDIGQVLNAVGLSTSDLFDHRLTDSKGQPPKIQLNEALTVIGREAMIVSMCAGRLLKNNLSDADRDRLSEAVNKIEDALNQAGVRRE